MSGSEVELFRSDDYVRAGQIPLGPLLRMAFEPLFGQSLDRCQFVLFFLPVADPTVIGGTPTVTNLRSGYGYVAVRIVADGRVIYQHPHSVREIVGVPLRRLLRQDFPDEKHWGFGIRAPGLDDVALVRPAPLGDGQVDVIVRPGRARRFHVEEIPEPDPPLTTLAALGVSGGVIAETDTVGVVLAEASHEALLRKMVFSHEVEEGGFLTGRVYRSAERPGSYLVMVTGAVPAERTGASLLHFTFTGESFLRMGDKLASASDGDQLVGWYHTHLFPATDALGLSSIDVDLHTTTFRAPWQIAGLLNLEEERRVLRFYRADGKVMASAAFWVVGH